MAVTPENLVYTTLPREVLHRVFSQDNKVVWGTHTAGIHEGKALITKAPLLVCILQILVEVLTERQIMSETAENTQSISDRERGITVTRSSEIAFL